MELLPSQSVAMDQIFNLIQNGEKRIVVKGSAGTGKTFMTNALIKKAKTDYYEYGAIYVIAPTHKALAVLKSKIEPKPYIHFMTAHSALKLKRKIDFKTGKETYVPEKYNPKNPPFKAAQMVVIDEGSMISSELMFGEGKFDQYPNLTMIFIGDHKQLPPVGEEESPVFSQGWPEVELTEIIRQGEGSPIIELSNNLQLIRTGENMTISNGDGFYFENMIHPIIERLAEVNGSDDMKYLAYINTHVNNMNVAVRKRIYGNPAKIEPGESLIFASPYTISSDRGYKNNEEIKVHSLKIVENYTLYVPTAQSQIIYEDGMPKTKIVKDRAGLPIPTETPFKVKIYVVNEEIRILHEDSQDMVAKILKAIISDCQKGIMGWPLKFWFEEQVANITYNHAITVHKSQGSTYKVAITDVGNINFNKSLTEKTKMLYTSVTRASNKVVLFNTRGLIL